MLHNCCKHYSAKGLGFRVFSVCVYLCHLAAIGSSFIDYFCTIIQLCKIKIVLLCGCRGRAMWFFQSHSATTLPWLASQFFFALSVPRRLTDRADKSECFGQLSAFFAKLKRHEKVPYSSERKSTFAVFFISFSEWFLAVYLRCFCIDFLFSTFFWILFSLFCIPQFFFSVVYLVDFFLIDKIIPKRYQRGLPNRTFLFFLLEIYWIYFCKKVIVIHLK